MYMYLGVDDFIYSGLLDSLLSPTLGHFLHSNMAVLGKHFHRYLRIQAYTL